jgi:NAD(P)-dependent dehydrogenase (short-subunit alcohol dehydrogenase family)
MLGEEGHSVTLVARRPEKLEAAYEQLRDAGLEVRRVAANVGDEADVARAVAAHRDAYGRLDVLVNNAGVGIGAPIGELDTKRMDIQLATNLRAIPLLYREAMPMLAAVRMLLSLTPGCVVPEIVFQSPGGGALGLSA